MVPMNFQQCWKAKLKKPHFFKVQSGKITVCELLKEKSLQYIRSIFYIPWPSLHCIALRSSRSWNVSNLVDFLLFILTILSHKYCFYHHTKVTLLDIHMFSLKLFDKIILASKFIYISKYSQVPNKRVYSISGCNVQLLALVIAKS